MPVHLREIKLSKEEKARYPDFQGIVILVYSDAYFDLFYERHCKKKHHKPESTVLVRDETDEPDKEEVITIFTRILLGPAFSYQATLLVPLPEPYYARTWSRIEKKFSDKIPARGRLRIEDCKEVSYNYMEKLCLQEILAQKDIDTVALVRRNAQKNRLLIKFVWFLGHIDILKT